MGTEQEQVKELLKDARYHGKFVALRSVTDDTVIAYGDDPREVRRLAAEKGVDNPLTLFVSKEDEIYKLSKYQL